MNSRILWTIFLTVFIDMIGIGILIPIFPMLIIPHSEFKITPDNWTLSHGVIMAGWLMATFPLMQFIFTPIIGQLSDRYGRRKLLILSVFGTFLSYILFAIAIITKSIPLMFISRITDGASGGNISTAQAVIGDISQAQDRAKNFGLTGVAIGIGFIFGPFLGGILSNSQMVSWFDASTPFWFAALLGFVNLCLLLKFLPETLKEKSCKAITIYTSITNIIKVFNNRELSVVIFSIFLFNAGFTFFTTFLGIILAYKFNFTTNQVGNFYAYMGVMIVLAQGLVVRPISGRVEEVTVLKFSIITTGLCILGYYIIPVNLTNLLYFVPPLIAICVATTKAFSSSLLTKIAKGNSLGEIMGINASFSALAQSIPAIFAGYIASYYLTYTIIVGAITAIIGGLLFIYKYLDKNNICN